MTIESGRDFLRLRRVDRSVSEYTKAVVVDVCIERFIYEIKHDNICNVNVFS